MNGEAKELRELAIAIQRLAAEHRVYSLAADQVQALCDYLCLRALVMELQGKLP